MGHLIYLFFSLYYIIIRFSQLEGEEDSFTGNASLADSIGAVER
jgi:hypothetical protein